MYYNNYLHGLKNIKAFKQANSVSSKLNSLNGRTNSSNIRSVTISISGFVPFFLKKGNKFYAEQITSFLKIVL